MHRNLDGLCSFLKECGIRITLLTTGLLLSKRASVVSEWVDDIIISIDGPEEVHDQVRRVKGGFRLIGDGIQAVRQRMPGMPIHGRTTVQKANHRLLRQTVLGAKSLSLDSISFLAADVTSQAFNRELVWPGERQSQVALTREELAALKDEIELLLRECAEEIRSRYIVESESKLRRIVRRFHEQLGDMDPVAPQCNAPWVSAVMEVDGSVRPCFFHKKVGSAHTITLEEVLNGDEARQFRASLDVSENAVCQRCVCSLNYKGGLQPGPGGLQASSSSSHNPAFAESDQPRHTRLRRSAGWDNRDTSEWVIIGTLSHLVGSSAHDNKDNLVTPSRRLDDTLAGRARYVYLGLKSVHCGDMRRAD